MRIVMLALALLLVAACAFPMLGGMNSADTIAVMQQENARGCLFIRGSATPFASAGFVAVGTWGPDPPAYEKCFTGMPLIP